MSDILFFGCWGPGPGQGGHHLYLPNGSLARTNPTPWKQIDSALVSGNPDGPQFVVERHQRDGWVALAFWDRTGDSRPGSNSVILLRTNHGGDVLDVARLAFPEQWERWKKAGAPFAAQAGRQNGLCDARRGT